MGVDRTNKEEGKQVEFFEQVKRVVAQKERGLITDQEFFLKVMQLVADETDRQIAAQYDDGEAAAAEYERLAREG